MGSSVLTLGGDAIIAFTEFVPSHYCADCDFNSADPGETRGECDCEDPFTVSRDCDSSCDHSDDWSDYVEWMQDTLSTMFPSLEAETGEWIDRELRVIARNSHSLVTVSEYCGSVAICLGANYDRGEYWREPSDGPANLGAHWRAQVSERFRAAFATLDRIGIMSNGESVYQVREGL